MSSTNLRLAIFFINVLFGKRLHGCGEIPYPCPTLPSRYLSLIKKPNRSRKYARRKSDIKFKTNQNQLYSITPLIRPPSESRWCGRIRGMVSPDGFIYFAFLQ